MWGPSGLGALALLLASTATDHARTRTPVHDPTTEERSPAGGRPRADTGATFVEVLVSIVLLGTIVVATLTGLRATIIGSEIDEDSARAQAWLQAAADEIFHTPYVDCASVSTYQAAADAATRPNEWDLASGAVIAVSSVQYLSRSGVSEQWGPTCAAGDPDSPLYAQLVTIVVTDPDGDFTKSLEVVKGV